MMLDTMTIPQADVLWHVARVPEAVRRGATTPAEIGAYLGEKSERQGHYYTQAARLLGLVTADGGDGTVRLSPYGRAFAGYDHPSQRRALRHILHTCPPMRAVIAALNAHNGLTLHDIAQVLAELAPLAPSTAQRRARTAAAWLREVGLAEWRDERLYYCRPVGVSGGR